MEPQDDAKSFDQLDAEQQSIFLEASKRSGLNLKDVLNEIPEIQGEALRAKIGKAVANAGIEDAVFDPEITAEVLKSQLE